MNVQPAPLNSLSRTRNDRPSVHLHIERLVLDGLPVNHHQGAFVQAAIETELTRLLAEGNLSAMSGGSLPHLPVASIQLAQDSQPSHMGHQIARAVYSGLQPARSGAVTPAADMHEVPRSIGHCSIRLRPARPRHERRPKL